MNRERVDHFIYTLRFLKEHKLTSLPETVEIDGGPRPDGSVIWLHGLGADGHDFEPIVPELALSGALDLRFVFPHAPVRPVTINGGMSMRAWFDILTLDREGPQDEAGIRSSGEQLLLLLEREHERGIPYDRILLAGFSQGGAVATHTALRCRERLAGLLALSAYLPLQDSFRAEVVNGDSQPRSLPVFMAHGSFDPVLPMALGEHARDSLVTAGFEVDWHAYPMAHAVCAEEIADIRRFLLSVFRAA
jgi:phospholipase/carboxylesterase